MKQLETKIISERQFLSEMQESYEQNKIEILKTVRASKFYLKKEASIDTSKEARKTEFHQLLNL